MMRGADVFPSRYLKAADLGRSRPVVTIERVESVTMQGQPKPVIYFVGKEKGLPLNRTNWVTLETITGEPDSDQWPGHQIRLYATKVLFQAQTVDAIRIDVVDQQTPVPTPAPVRTPPVVVTEAFPNVVAAPAVDDISF